MASLHDVQRQARKVDAVSYTHLLISQELPRLGVQVSWGANVAEFAAAVRPETRLIYVEDLLADFAAALSMELSLIHI